MGTLIFIGVIVAAIIYIIAVYKHLIAQETLQERLRPD